jgi:general secretion pathway protein L
MASAIDGAVQQFLRWWGGELLGLLPRSLRGIVAPPPVRLELVMADGGLEIREERDGVSQTVATLSDPEAAPRLRARITRLGRAADAVVLRLPEAQVLETEIAVPSAAAGQLRDVIEMEMSRVTPFEPTEVVFDHKVVDSDLEKEQLILRLCIARRADVQTGLVAAAALGLSPTRVDTQVGETFNLLPPDARPRSSRTLPTLIAAALVGVLLLGAATLWMQFARQASTLSMLEARAAEVRERALRVSATETEAEALLGAAGAIAAEKAASPLLSVLIAEIAEHAPDGSWFTEIALRGDGLLRLTGRSNASSDLLRRLGDSPFLRDLRFAAPLVAEGTDGGERFTIEARVTGPAAGSGAQP